jgi:hypothetical protein
MLKTEMLKIRTTLLLGIGILFGVSDLYADQYLTDTPVPIDYKKVKINFASRIDDKVNSTSIRVPLVQLSMGLYPDLQGQVSAYGVSSIKKGRPTQYGYGDVRVGVKYRFLHETDWVPQVAFYPKFRLPTGHTSGAIGSDGALEKIPLWAQKSWGPWKLSGGGGYAFNQGSGKVDYAYGGALLRRDFSQCLTLGGELYAQGTASPSNRKRLVLNFGGTYNFSEKYNMLFSAGHSIAGEEYFVAYLGFGLEI